MPPIQPLTAVYLALVVDGVRIRLLTGSHIIELLLRVSATTLVFLGKQRRSVVNSAT